jgi:hypothetical protein
MISRNDPPAITHPGFYYGFVSVGLAWQVAFFVIARDPVRFRLMMIPGGAGEIRLRRFLPGFVFAAATSSIRSRVWRSGCAVRRAVSACVLSDFGLDIPVRGFGFDRIHRTGAAMNRRSFLKWANLAGLTAGIPSLPAIGTVAHEAESVVSTSAAKPPSTARLASPETILLKDYRPKSIYKIPVTEIARAKFPIIDMHSHPYAKTAKEIDAWVGTMDEVGVEKTIILTMATGAEFDEISGKYSKHPSGLRCGAGSTFRATTSRVSARRP